MCVITDFLIITDLFGEYATLLPLQDCIVDLNVEPSRLLITLRRRDIQAR
jgi:hypothetical protein